MNAAQHPSRASRSPRTNALCQQPLIPRQKSIRQCPAGRGPSISELLPGAIPWLLLQYAVFRDGGIFDH